MSHSIYTTEGFVLKSLNFGEANKYFFIFTKNFGLIKATAQGVRYLRSKLRYGLEDFSLAQISLVRGREVWRLTSAEKKLNIKDKEKLLLISRIFSLLLRLLHGEEQNNLLFDSVKEGMVFLNNYNDRNLESFECILALRILSTLGYIGKLADFDQFTQSSYFTSELLTKMSILKKRAVWEINKSLQETHL
jgi:DNA repair protein RecO